MGKIIIGILAFIVILGLFAFCGWAVSLLLNVALSQMGLNSISFWGGCCILASAQTIKTFICFGK